MEVSLKFLNFQLTNLKQEGFCYALIYIHRRKNYITIIWLPHRTKQNTWKAIILLMDLLLLLSTFINHGSYFIFSFLGNNDFHCLREEAYLIID